MQKSLQLQQGCLWMDSNLLAAIAGHLILAVLSER